MLLLFLSFLFCITETRLVKNRIVDCSTTDGDDVENLAAKKKKGVNFRLGLGLSLPCFATLSSASHLSAIWHNYWDVLLRKPGFSPCIIIHLVGHFVVARPKRLLLMLSSSHFLIVVDPPPSSAEIPRQERNPQFFGDTEGTLIVDCRLCCCQQVLQ